MRSNPALARAAPSLMMAAPPSRRPRYCWDDEDVDDDGRGAPLRFHKHLLTSEQRNRFSLVPGNLGPFHTEGTRSTSSTVSSRKLVLVSLAPYPFSRPSLLEALLVAALIVPELPRNAQAERPVDPRKPSQSNAGKQAGASSLEDEDRAPPTRGRTPQRGPPHGVPHPAAKAPRNNGLVSIIAAESDPRTSYNRALPSSGGRLLFGGSREQRCALHETRDCLG